MLHAFDPRRLVVVALLCGAFSASCGPVVELTLVLERGNDADGDPLDAAATANLQSMRVVLHIEDQDKPEVFTFAFDRTKPARLASDVAPGQRFDLDVSGCETPLDPDPAQQSCVAPVVRGCTEPITVSETDTRPAVTVTLFAQDADEATRCPIGF